MNLSIKIKTIIIIILFLNLLFLNLDFDLSAKTPNAGTDEFASDKVKSLSSEDFIWSQIEVISEPIFGQNFDWGNSH